jgi:hypothetical protein
MIWRKLTKLTLPVALGCIVLFVDASAQQPPLKNAQVENIVKEISAGNIRATIETLVSFGTRHSLSDTLSQTRGIGAARQWILQEFKRYAQQSNGRLDAELQQTIVPPSQRVPFPTAIVNVIATLKPSHPGPSAGRIIVVSGHYDSRASNAMDFRSDAPGADDDGSGVAVVLELCRVICKCDFDATIVFAAFGGEEQGLFGSTALAEKAREQGLGIEAVFNNDMVGSGEAGDGTKESSYVRVFSEAFNPLDTGGVFRQRVAQGLENDGGSRSLARYFKEVGERYNPGFGAQLIYRLDRFLRGGDHKPFHDRGFRAVRICEVKENYNRQHQDIRTENGREYGDLPKFVNYEYCANIAKMNAASIATLASAPQPPSKVEVVTAQLSNQTELRWQRNPESDIAGYLVRCRLTNAPMWEQSFLTTEAAITLKLSKDDYIFGVQAVDKDGNASLVTLPRPSGRQ